MEKCKANDCILIYVYPDYDLNEINNQIASAIVTFKNSQGSIN